MLQVPEFHGDGVSKKLLCKTTEVTKLTGIVMWVYKNYTHASQSIWCKKSRIQERLFVPCSKPQLVYMSAPVTKQEICPRLL